MNNTFPLADLVGHIVGRAQAIAGTAQQDANQVARDARAFMDSAHSLVESARGTAAATPRMARIVATAASIGWLYQMDRARRNAVGDSSPWSSGLHRRCAIRVRELCEQLRGGTLKVGQLASTRMDLLPDEWIEELSKLRDQAPAIEYAAIESRVAQELGDLSQHFSYFEEQALAAASLAQVHAATTTDGLDVVVKVQLPDIEKAIEADIKALSITASALADSAFAADLPTTMAELSRALREELNYVQEADAQRRFYHRYEFDERVVIPNVVSSLSTHRVLTMERIHGLALDQFLENSDSAARTEILTTLIDLVCEQVLHFGELHADPHPGNFLVTPEGKLAFLDFGCVATFSDSARAAYAQIALAALAGQRERVGELLIAMGFATADGSSHGIAKYADEVMAPFRDPLRLAAFARDPSQQLRAAIALARENPIVSVPSEFVLLARVFASLAGLLIAYAPNINLGGILSKHLLRHVV